MTDYISFDYINIYLNDARREDVPIEVRKHSLKIATGLLYNYINENEDILRKSKERFTIINTLNIVNTFLNTFVAIINKNNLNFIAACCWLLSFVFCSLRLNSDNEMAKKIKKYKYFLENQDTINQEIIERFIEDNKDCNSYSLDDAPVITVADIDDMDIKELKETVQLIRRTH